MTSLGRLATKGIGMRKSCDRKRKSRERKRKRDLNFKHDFLFFTNVYKKHLQTTEINDTFQLSFTYVRASPRGNGKKRKLKIQEQKGLG